MSSFFVAAGLTYWHYIEEAPGLWPAAWVRYVPAGPGVRQEYREAAFGEKLKVAADVICKRVKEFRVMTNGDGEALNGGRGEPIKLIPSQLIDPKAPMHADVFDELLNLVVGYGRPNKPQGPDGAADRQTPDVMEKNSPTGSD